MRACSLAARGLWTDLLCLMWESPERGVLKTGDQPWGPQEMASAVGADITLVTKLLAELKGKGVASSRAEDGALYSRRMVRDEAERRKETERQRRYRGSNPAADAIAVDTRNVTPGVTPLSHHSSVSSSSTNLSLNFAGAVEATEQPQNPNARLQKTAVSRTPDTKLEELRLQAEILGRQERLFGKRSGTGGGNSIAAGPVAADFGVRAKASAIDRARARDARAAHGKAQEAERGALLEKEEKEEKVS